MIRFYERLFPANRKAYWKILGKDIIRDRELYLLLLPVLANFIIFHYLPIYGLQVAFKRYNIGLGIAGSPWVGFTNFINFFTSFNFVNITLNTLIISLYLIVIGFPLPIIFALILNEVRHRRFKKFTQTISYLPNFISSVVLVGMLFQLFAQLGPVNQIIEALGGETVYFLGSTSTFRPLYVGMELWRGTGFGAIIYISAITSIDQELYEAASIDGANALKRMWHITLPCLLPTITIIFILRMGGILNVGWQEIYLIQNPSNVEVAEVIGTFVYKRGMINADYAYGSAVGMFNSIISLLFVLMTNQIAKRVGETTLF